MSETDLQTAQNPQGDEKEIVVDGSKTPEGEESSDKKEEIDQDKAPFTMSDFKKYKSDVERWVQKLMETHRRETDAQRKEAEVKEQVLDAMQLVIKDQENLLDVYKKSPAAAKIILEKYYGGISIEKFQKEYLWYEDIKVSTQVDEDEIIRKHETKKQSKEMEERFSKRTSELEAAWLSESEITKIKEEYDDILGGRVVDESKQKKVFHSVYYTVVGKSIEDNTSKVTKQAAAWGAGWQKTPKSTDIYSDPSIKFLLEQWILKWPTKK
jgi:hypothetical protein